MGSNHWENWQLAYRQKRAAEARATAAEADAARMREALERIARETITDHIGDVWASPAAITARAALVRARNALGGKDE